MNKKTYKLNEEIFNKENLNVTFLKKTKLPDKELKFKIGTKKIVTYRDETVENKVIKNFYADVSYEEIYKNKMVPQYEIEFSFVNDEDEKAFLKNQES